MQLGMFVDVGDDHSYELLICRLVWRAEDGLVKLSFRNASI